MRGRRGGHARLLRAVAAARPRGRGAGPSRERRGDRGASAVELSIVAPGLLLLIFLGVQTGLWLFGRNVAEQAARESVSRLRIVGIGDGADVASALAAAEAQARNYVVGVGGSLVRDPAAEAVTLGDDRRVRVSVSGSAVSLVPGLDLAVRGSAEGDVERFQVDS